MSVKLLFFLLAVVIQLSFVLCGPAVKSNYIEQERSCREVCGLCDCDGFYCEDECICECSIKDEDNLQCIADMKTECDKNGLEYELLMQEATKERFLRQIRPDLLPFEKLSKNLVIIKKKREDTTAAPPPVEEPKPSKPSEDPKLAAPQPVGNNPLFPNLNFDLGNLDLGNFNLGNLDLNNLPGIGNGPKLQLPDLTNFEPGKLMMTIRENITPPPPPPTLPPPREIDFSNFPKINFPTISLPSNMPDFIVQPRELFS